MDEELGDFPVYHLEDLLPDQLALIDLLGGPAVVGSYETSTYLSNPAEGVYPPHYRSVEGAVIASIGAPHAVLYTCPVVMVLGRPRIILPNGDLREVPQDQVGPPLEHWPVL